MKYEQILKITIAGEKEPSVIQAVQTLKTLCNTLKDKWARDITIKACVVSMIKTNSKKNLFQALKNWIK